MRFDHFAENRNCIEFIHLSILITQNIDIKNANIVDVIDPRFQLVGNDGNVITDEALKQG